MIDFTHNYASLVARLEEVDEKALMCRQRQDELCARGQHDMARTWHHWALQWVMVADAIEGELDPGAPVQEVIPLNEKHECTYQQWRYGSDGLAS